MEAVVSFIVRNSGVASYRHAKRAQGQVIVSPFVRNGVDLPGEGWLCASPWSDTRPHRQLARPVMIRPGSVNLLFKLGLLIDASGWAVPRCW